jgi:hypothetical protein
MRYLSPLSPQKLVKKEPQRKSKSSVKTGILLAWFGGKSF